MHLTGTTIWSPLASGLLTGKYNTEIPAGSRASDESYAWLQGTVQRWRKEGKIDKVYFYNTHIHIYIV